MDKANERRKRCKVKEREGEEIMICRNVIPLSRISKSFLLVIELLLILIPCINALRFNGFVSVNIYVNVFFFYLGFLSRTFSNHRTAGEVGGHFFNFSLPLPPASRALRHQPGDYCRKLTSAHSQQPDSNGEPLVSKRKSLTTKLRAYVGNISIMGYYPRNGQIGDTEPVLNITY